MPTKVSIRLETKQQAIPTILNLPDDQWFVDHDNDIGVRINEGVIIFTKSGPVLMYDSASSESEAYLESTPKYLLNNVRIMAE